MLIPLIRSLILSHKSLKLSPFALGEDRLLRTLEEVSERTRTVTPKIKDEDLISDIDIKLVLKLRLSSCHTDTSHKEDINSLLISI